MTTFFKKKEIKRDEEHFSRYATFDAKILYPALGCPAVVKKEGEEAWLEIIIAGRKKELKRSEVAFHLRYSEWNRCDGHISNYKRLKMFKDYFLKHNHSEDVNRMIMISEPYKITDDRINDSIVHNDGFKLQLGLMNVFPWILKLYRESGYPYLYKIRVNLKYEPDCFVSGKLMNFLWVERFIYEKVKEESSLLQVAVDKFKKLFKEEKKIKVQLSEFGPVPDGQENMNILIYHPVFVSKKARLAIGHVTDIHLDTRMELYSKSVASVIEIKENCPKGIVIQNNKRVVKNTEFYKPIKTLVANFNEIFMNISDKLLTKADTLVITGDLIDYNKGVHTDQTLGDKEKKPSEAWAALKSNLINFDNKEHQEDRNWFLFYKLLLQLYKTHHKPIFTTLGNHDYCMHATAPWPLFGKAWNGVYDMNLTRYENALCYGEGFSKDKEFVANSSTNVECVKWYTFFINPFPDYVIDYGDQSLFMVDWGEKAIFPPKGVSNAMVGLPKRHPGSLHHAANMFREKNEYEEVVTTVDSNGKEKTIIKKKGTMPFLIKNYTIYKSWIERPAAVRMLFTHATAICPRDDISVGEINTTYSWKDDELCYGTFDHRREKVLKDIENGHLHIFVGGHSHRNVVMRLNKKVKHPMVIAAGETVNTGYITPSHLTMVTSSGGPFPKYLPGAPLICACPKYETGFYYEWKKPSLSDLKLKQLYSGGDFSKKALPANSCPHCNMEGGDMIRKPARRHTPGGNLLIFENETNGRVRIETVLAENSPNAPNNRPTKARTAVMCEEQDVFTGDMRLDGINSFKEFNEWDSRNLINIISVEPFIHFGHMKFPSRIKYVTFKKGLLLGDDKVDFIKTGKKYAKRVRQTIIKDSFDKLKRAATHDSDFAFTRYTFSGSDIWDREINVGKTKMGHIKDVAEYMQSVEEENIALHGMASGLPEDSLYVKSADQKKSYDSKKQGFIKDDYRDMIINFSMKPDFNKRKKTNVCGY